MIWHITWLPRVRGYEGIEAKLSDLQRGADRAGVDLRVIVLTDDSPGGIRLPIRDITGWPRRLRPLMRCKTIANSLPLAEAEGVVLRYPGACDLGAPEFLARYGHRIVTEHHTDEPTEYRMLRAGWLRSVAEQMFDGGFLGAIAGGIFVTQELADRCRDRGLRAPVVVIGNGVVVNRFPAWRQAAIDQTIHAMMVSGVFWNWQGLDRVLLGMLASRPVPLQLHLVGEVRLARDLELIAACNRQRPGSVVCHGSLDAAGIDALAVDMHVAISTLALHRKAMTQACPIKSREYAARGIPFLYAYDDPDLPDGLPGTFRMVSNESPVNPETIIELATQRAGSAGELRAFAMAKLDYAEKARQMVAFVRRVVGT